jgi:hypothetical protein
VSSGLSAYCTSLTPLLLLSCVYVTGMEKEFKPYGCGEFTYESYLIFCCGQGLKVQPADKNLRAYCAWLRRNAPVMAVDVV